MTRKMICLIGVLALALCAMVVSEKNIGDGGLDFSADAESFRTVVRMPRALEDDASFSEGSRESAAEWRANWERALALDDEPETGLSRGGASENEEAAFAFGFGDFGWDAGWKGCGLFVEDI